MLAWIFLSENVASSLQDTDLVPSDVAAGLTLLHQEQDKVENCPKEPDEVLTQSPASPVVREPGDLPGQHHWGLVDNLQITFVGTFG